MAGTRGEDNYYQLDRRDSEILVRAIYKTKGKSIKIGRGGIGRGGKEGRGGGEEEEKETKTRSRGREEKCKLRRETNNDNGERGKTLTIWGNQQGN